MDMDLVKIYGTPWNWYHIDEKYQQFITTYSSSNIQQLIIKNIKKPYKLTLSSKVKQRNIKKISKYLTSLESFDFRKILYLFNNTKLTHFRYLSGNSISTTLQDSETRRNLKCFLMGQKRLKKIKLLNNIEILHYHLYYLRYCQQRPEIFISNHEGYSLDIQYLNSNAFQFPKQIKYKNLFMRITASSSNIEIHENFLKSLLKNHTSSGKVELDFYFQNSYTELSIKRPLNERFLQILPQYSAIPNNFTFKFSMKQLQVNDGDCIKELMRNCEYLALSNSNVEYFVSEDYSPRNDIQQKYRKVLMIHTVNYFKEYDLSWLQNCTKIKALDVQLEYKEDLLWEQLQNVPIEELDHFLLKFTEFEQVQMLNDYYYGYLKSSKKYITLELSKFRQPQSADFIGQLGEKMNELEYLYQINNNEEVPLFISKIKKIKNLEVNVVVLENNLIRLCKQQSKNEKNSFSEKLIQQRYRLELKIISFK